MDDHVKICLDCIEELDLCELNQNWSLITRLLEGDPLTGLDKELAETFNGQIQQRFLLVQELAVALRNMCAQAATMTDSDARLSMFARFGAGLAGVDVGADRVPAAAAEILTDSSVAAPSEPDAPSLLAALLVRTVHLSVAKSMLHVGLSAAVCFVYLVRSTFANGNNTGPAVFFNPFVWRPVLNVLTSWKKKSSAGQLSRPRTASSSGSAAAAAHGQVKKRGRSAAVAKKQTAMQKSKRQRQKKRQPPSPDHLGDDVFGEEEDDIGLERADEPADAPVPQPSDVIGNTEILVELLTGLFDLFQNGPGLSSQPDAVAHAMELLLTVGRTSVSVAATGASESVDAVQAERWVNRAALHSLVPLLLDPRHGPVVDQCTSLARLLLPVLGLSPDVPEGSMVAKGAVPRLLAVNCDAVVALCEQLFSAEKLTALCKLDRNSSSSSRRGDSALPVDTVINLLPTVEPLPVCPDGIQAPFSPVVRGHGDDVGVGDPSWQSLRLRDIDLREPIHALLQQLCVFSGGDGSASNSGRVSIPSEWRNRTATTVCRLVRQCLPAGLEQQRFCDFLTRLSRNRRGPLREFAVRVADAWISQRSGRDDVDDDDNSCGPLSGSLAALLAARTTDRMATVRSRALAGLANICDSSSSSASLFSSPDEVLVLCRSRISDESAHVRKAAVRLLEALHLVFASAGDPLVADADMGALVSACADSSLVVRRQGAQTLTRLLTQWPDKAILRTAWRGAVLPLVSDDEPSMAELASSLVRQVCATAFAAGDKQQTFRGPWMPLVDEISHGQLAPFVASAFRSLQSRPQLFQAELQPLVQSVRRAIDEWQNQRQSDGEGVADSLPAGLLGSWRLLGLLVGGGGSRPGKQPLQQSLAVTVPAKWSVDHWCRRSTQANPLVASACLAVIRGTAGRVPVRLAADVCRQLVQAMEQMEFVDCSLLHECCATALALHHRSGGTQATATNTVPAWVPVVLGSCERRLVGCLQATAGSLQKEQLLQLHRQTDGVDDTDDVSGGIVVDAKAHAHAAAWAQQQNRGVVCAALFLVGALGQRYFALVPSRLLLAVQTLIVQPPADVGDLPEHLVPGSVRAQALVTLGKLCLQSSRLAKRCVDAFAQELASGDRVQARRQADDADRVAARNNALVLMCDLCCRYASLVDTHLPTIAGRLSDPSELIRRHAIELLGRLLRQDFIRWRAPLFQRFALALVDPSPSVRAAAEAVLDALVARTHRAVKLSSGRPAAARDNNGPDNGGDDDNDDDEPAGGSCAADKKSLCTISSTASPYAKHFVSMLFVLNECDHLKFCVGLSGADGATDDGGSVWGRGMGLTGDQRRPRRLHIYRHFARRMSAEERLEVSAAVCEEVIAAAASAAGHTGDAAEEGGGGGGRRWPLSDPAHAAVLADALAVLAMPSMQPNASPTAATDALIDETAAASAEQTEEALVNLVASISADSGAGTTDDDNGKEARRARAIDEARGRLLSKVTMRQLAEQIIPAVVALKRRLERERSPLLRPLMAYLAYLLDTYKDEVRDVLRGDRVLAAEVEYDCRQFAEARAARVAQANRQRDQDRVNQTKQLERALMPPPPPASLSSSSATRSRSMRTPPRTPKPVVATNINIFETPRLRQLGPKNQPNSRSPLVKLPFKSPSPSSSSSLSRRKSLTPARPAVDDDDDDDEKGDDRSSNVIGNTAGDQQWTVFLQQKFSDEAAEALRKIDQAVSSSPAAVAAIAARTPAKLKRVDPSENTAEADPTKERLIGSEHRGGKEYTAAGSSADGGPRQGVTSSVAASAAAGARGGGAGAGGRHQIASTGGGGGGGGGGGARQNVEAENQRLQAIIRRAAAGFIDLSEGALDTAEAEAAVAAATAVAGPEAAAAAVSSDLNKSFVVPPLDAIGNRATGDLSSLLATLETPGPSVRAPDSLAVLSRVLTTSPLTGSEVHDVRQLLDQVSESLAAVKPSPAPGCEDIQSSLIAQFPATTAVNSSLSSFGDPGLSTLSGIGSPANTATNAEDIKVVG